jgi:hopanoid biosynthesis associated RND transporter like protein HpnN
MSKLWRINLDSLLSAWIDITWRYRIVVIALFILGAIFSINYTVKHIGMDTDTRDMLSPKLPWRQLDLKIDKLFPQTTDSLLVVIEAGTPDEALDSGKLLYDRLHQEHHLFKSVFFAPELSNFKQSSLLYLDTGELQDVSNRLATIQPFLARLTEDRSLRGLFTMLSDAAQAKIDGNTIDLSSLVTRLDRAFNALLKGEYYRLSWQALLENTDENRDVYRQFIVLQPVLDFDELLPAQKPIARVRAIARDLQLTPENHIRIRLTGTTALAHEELTSVFKGMEYSTIISFLLVAMLLVACLRSMWLVAAALVTLVTGLIYTACFAAFAVGNLNLISIAFAVLYIGLGIDYAIHFCLHYRDLLEQGQSNRDAIRHTAITIGKSLLLCTATTSIGFYAFIPTSYSGVAELGLISGTGMFISYVVTMTFLPALLGRFPGRITPGATRPTLDRVVMAASKFPVQHARKIEGAAIILTLVALIAVAGLKFDHNTLNLQSPKNESVKTYLDLLADKDTSPWTITALVDSPDEARRLINRLDKLPLVNKVVWLEDFIPADQETKLGLVEEMDLLLGPLSTQGVTPRPDDQAMLTAMETFHHKLGELVKTGTVGTDYENLYRSMDRFLVKLKADAGSQHHLLDELQASLLANFSGRIESLLQSMNAVEINRKTLPQELTARWVSDGHYRLEVYPKEDLMDNGAMQRFVDQVRTVSTDIIGAPVVSIEAGNTVVTAFKQAFIVALVVITLFLLMLVDRKIDMVYILIPLLLAALYSGALLDFLDIPLNFANIIALPLLLGVGVDNGIHILHRARSRQHLDHTLLSSSAARAVIYSALTTMASFGNLAFSSHLGTASMGLLLTIGIAMTLICTLVILPGILVNHMKAG